jgi:hypothetical protein
MRTRQQTIFRYSELSGKAKDRARDWIIEGMWDFLGDELRDRFEEELDEAGFPGAKVKFSLSSSQGDGVTFDVPHLDLRAWLKAQSSRVEDEFKSLEREGGLNIFVQTSHRYFNPPKVLVEPTYRMESSVDEKLIVALEKAIQESANKVCREMTQTGYEIIDFRQSDEEIAEHAEANDYEFDESGRPA